MSDEMEVSRESENRKDSIEDMELGSDSRSESKNKSTEQKNDNDVIRTEESEKKTSPKFSAKNLLKLDIPKNESPTSQADVKVAEAETSALEMSDEIDKHSDCMHSPPVFSNSQTFSANASNSEDSPFQKPSVCRTHSLGGGDTSPFVIHRRPGKLAFSNPLRSPSAFKTKHQMRSPIRPDLLDEMEDSALKRCNSAPMLNEINDIDARMSWHHGSVTPGAVRARRFSATVLSSPSSGSAKSTSRLHQLKKEESIEGIQHKEAAHEREVQTSLQMYHTCEELTLSDGLNGSESAPATSSSGPMPRTLAATEPPARSPLPYTAPVSIPVPGKHAPTRAIDFTLSSAPLHNLHPPGGSIPSPLTISTGPLCLAPLPPSPTRNLGFSSTGKQCFSPSMQIQVPLPAQYLRPGSLSPSPSPTRRTFVTRRRSQSPCVVKPSALGPIKRKHDSDSEGGCSPKRIFLPSSHATVNHTQGEPFSYNVVMPHFSRNSIHRSHSLSSSSLDSDINVSPSPPQNVVNLGFQPSTHPLGTINNPHHPRDGRTGSPFQPPQHAMQDLARCSSPASSTCSSSSLEGLRDLPPFPQSHLATHSSNNPTPTLSKQAVKERRPSGASVPMATMNVT